MKLKFQPVNIHPLFIESLEILSEEEPIIKQVVEICNNEKDLSNYLISALVCILEREKISQNAVAQVIDSNAHIKDILRAKNDTLSNLPTH